MNKFDRTRFFFKFSPVKYANYGLGCSCCCCCCCCSCSCSFLPASSQYCSPPIPANWPSPRAPQDTGWSRTSSVWPDPSSRGRCSRGAESRRLAASSEEKRWWRSWSRRIVQIEVVGSEPTFNQGVGPDIVVRKVVQWNL